MQRRIYLGGSSNVSFGNRVEVHRYGRHQSISMKSNHLNTICELGCKYFDIDTEDINQYR